MIGGSKRFNIALARVGLSYLFKGYDGSGQFSGKTMVLYISPKIWTLPGIQHMETWQRPYFGPDKWQHCIAAKIQDSRYVLKSYTKCAYSHIEETYNK